MKVNIEELIKERRATPWCWDFDVYEDSMVDNAIAKNEKEFAVILCPNALKHARARTKCVFPALKRFYVTGIFDIGAKKSRRKIWTRIHVNYVFCGKTKANKNLCNPQGSNERWVRKNALCSGGSGLQSVL